MVIAAYNEEAIIEDKIKNCLSLDYPSISFLFITDGSNDNTVDIIAQYPWLRLLHQPKRMGKSAALNRAMVHVQTDITVFCDANSMLNRSAIKKIVSHYQDDNIGGVAGEKKIININEGNVTGTGEGLYWKYESYLKKLDAALYTVTGAAGELFSIRTSLWEPLPEDVILDDFVISAKINLRGFRIGYEPMAYAYEQSSASIEEERKRKIRISAGAFQAMGLVKQLFNIFHYPVLFFQFFSHRFLRWTLTPLSLPILLVANTLLVISGSSLFFRITLVAQFLFYLFALTEICWVGTMKKSKISKICYYVLFMNYSVYLGFFRFLKGSQSAVWDKATRENIRISSIM
jgi:cellulose synthase/poly-beta-1,6-N-acetylglucosamine synthase-like glycosyltransferase